MYGLLVRIEFVVTIVILAAIAIITITENARDNANLPDEQPIKVIGDHR